MTRQLTTHVSNPANDKLKITVLDEPGQGNANHLYLIEGMDYDTNPSKDVLWARVYAKQRSTNACFVLFQNGPIAEVGVNGVTHEALLALLIDRMQAFQAGPYACRENALALTKLEEALAWLNKRTERRVAEGVEGTHKGS